jgi:hypothetical protein
MLLLHEGKPEDNVKAFFMETHELYAKHLMNPFASVESPIMYLSYFHIYYYSTH